MATESKHSARRRLKLGSEEELNKKRMSSSRTCVEDNEKRKDKKMQRCDDSPRVRDQAASGFFTPKKFSGVDKNRTVKHDISHLSTPTLVEDSSQDYTEGQGIQTYSLPHLFKNVEYRVQGTSSLSKETSIVFQFVMIHFTIPDDFETKREFGPWSGSSFEERVIAAYNMGQLRPKETNCEKGKVVSLPMKMDSLEENLRICTFCAETGHIRFECSKLV